jgi:cobalt-zinc-cadmium efflux system membrane fusion protein
MKLIIRSRLTTTALLTLVLAVSACKPAQVPSTGQAAGDPMQVQAPESLRAQIQVTEVAQQELSDTLRVAGAIEFDEQSLNRIGASVTGRVTQLHAVLGQLVQKGQPLAQIHSSELSAAQLSFLKAKSATELNRRNVDRAQTLFQADVISAAELQRRQSEYEIAAAEMRASQDQLRVLGMTSEAIEQLAKSGAIDSNANVVASLSGVVVERKVVPGQVVQPSDALFVVADLQRVWAVAQVPEQQVFQVQVGQKVRIEVPALNKQEIVGRLIFVGQTVNPETRTVLVRTELDNAKGILKPAMLATMLIDSAPSPRIVVPHGAVVREDDQDFVFVEVSPNTYRLSPVKLEAERNGVRIVTQGLKTGQRIVSDGAFHLNNHRNLLVVSQGD